MISAAHIHTCVNLTKLSLWRFSVHLMFFGIVFSCATSGQAEIQTGSRKIYDTERSILVGFSYGEKLVYLLAEDHILELAKSMLADSRYLQGNSFLSAELSSTSSVSFVRTTEERQGCHSVFGTIQARSFYFEFGVLWDPTRLSEIRPIVAASHLFNCSREYDTDQSISYRMRSVDDRKNLFPIRLLSVDIETREATIVEIEVEQ